MKKGIGIVLLFMLLLLGNVQEAKAQFWKRIFKKEEPRRKPPVRKPANKEKQPSSKPTAKKKQEINYPRSVMKQRYRVDVLIPLYLDELVVDGKPVSKGKLPDKAEPGMDFYEGVKLAADTLDNLGYSIDVYIHDITSKATSPEQLIAHKTLDSSDLIIGALQSQQIPALAAYAAKNEVNFISALSPSDADVKDNPYYILMQPTLKSHCHLLTENLRKKYGNRKPVLYYRTDVSVDKEAYDYLTEDNNITYRQVLCNNKPTRQQLTALFDSTDVNVIVMGIIENAYAESLLNELNELFPNYRFEVYGMPSWRSLQGIRKTDAYPNVAVNFTSPFYFDITTASGQALSNMYKKAFGSTKPGEMVYRGYETMYWFAYLLSKYGTIFNPKLKDSGVAPFTRYEIAPERDNDGSFLYNENKHVYLFRYQGGGFSVEQ